MKIRIGNDVKLVVDIRQYNFANILKEKEVFNPENQEFENIDDDDFVNKSTEVYYENPSNLASGDSKYVNNKSDIYYNPDYIEKKQDKTIVPVNIRSIKAIFINTSKQQEYDNNLKKKTRFISRFPIEPCIEAFKSTEYNICNSGYPTYRAYPVKRLFAPYHGFGVNPDWCDIYPTPKQNDTEYIADVAATSDPNIISVSFPAEQQLHVGTYKLIIVAKLYVPGYNHNNVRTVTIDLPEVFELVSSSEEAYNSDITINVHRIYEADEPVIVDNYLNESN